MCSEDEEWFPGEYNSSNWWEASYGKVSFFLIKQKRTTFEHIIPIRKMNWKIDWFTLFINIGSFASKWPTNKKQRNI